jgi:hypothetical protein
MDQESTNAPPRIVVGTSDRDVTYIMPRPFSECWKTIASVNQRCVLSEIDRPEEGTSLTPQDD